MPRRPFARLVQFGSAIALLGLLSVVQAVELGDVAVRSYRGQPLVADVELVALTDENASVQVRMANPDVYRGANIGMHPALSSLNLSVMRRDGRQYLHITSLKPIDTERVHLFLDLVEGGRGVVRGATLPISPDPQPERPSTPAPAPTAAQAPAATVAPAPESGPSSQALDAAKARLAMRQAAAVPAAATPLAPPRRAEPAACGPRFSAEQIKTCEALDYKNAVLTAQIVELEEKVTLLQATMAVQRAGAGPLRTVALPVPGGAPAKDAQAARPQATGTSWLPIAAGGGGIALIGALAYAIWRKKRKGGLAQLVMPNFFSGLKNRLSRKRPVQEPALAEEPTLE